MRTAADSTSAVTRLLWLIRKLKATMQGIATARPIIVAFIAVEIPAARSADFCWGSACPTASNELIRPAIVPKRPSSVATLAMVERKAVRRWIDCCASWMEISSAFSISASGWRARSRACFTTTATGFCPCFSQWASASSIRPATTCLPISSKNPWGSFIG